MAKDKVIGKAVNAGKALDGAASSQSGSLQQRINRRAEIKDRISAINSEISGLAHLRPQGETPAALQSRINSLIARHGGGIEGNITSARVKEELAALRREHAAKLQKFQEVSGKERELRNELAALQEELLSFEYAADATDVLDHLRNVRDAAAVVASLKSAMAEQQGIIEANSAVTVGDLHQRRQDLLAESAMGENVAGDLAQLEAEIEKKEATVAEAKKLKANAEHCLVGLKRKLAEAEQAVAGLEAGKNDILHHFLMSQAEEVGKEYLQTARELQAVYARLMGLNELIQSLAVGATSFSLGAYRIEIPSFSLKAFSGSTSSEKVFTGQGFDTGAACRDEITRLAEIGITI